MRDAPDPLPFSALEKIYGPPVTPKTPESVDEEWQEATILAGALWLAGAVGRTDAALVAKVKLALRYTRHRRPNDPLADLLAAHVEEESG